MTRDRSVDGHEVLLHHLGTLQQLLEIHEWTALEQTRNLERVIEKLTMSTGALAESRAEIQRKSELLRSVLDSMTEAVIVSDPDGKLVIFNPAAERLLGIQASDVSVRDFFGRRTIYLSDAKTVFPPEQFPISRALKGETVENLEAFITHPDDPMGSWLNLTGCPLAAADGSPSGALCVAQDITARKRAALDAGANYDHLRSELADLKETQRNVVQQERLKALGQMASGVAHDFNNALSPVLGFSDIVLARPEILSDKKQTLRYFELINTAARDAAHIIGRLLQFYRGGSENERSFEVNVNKVIEEVIALTKPKWNALALARGAVITVHLDLNSIPAIAGNPPELRELLINLIFNAVDALPTGGQIMIRTELIGADPKIDEAANTIRFDDEREDRLRQSVLIEVSDTGVGMSEETRKKCLEPFFSTKGNRGSGLGLATVFGCVERHKGRIEIESAPGKGSIFRIYLPLEGALRVDIEEGFNKAPVRSLRVLLVEDEAPVREVLTQFIELDGHSVVSAENGLKAMEIFQPGEFDLVITDMVMPGMCGDELSMAIGRSEPSLPIIMVTGFGNLIDSQGLELCGVRDIVSKPATLSDLRRAVHKVMLPEAA